MSASSRCSPSLWREIALAAALSLGGALLFHAGTGLLPAGWTLRGVLLALFAAYVGALLYGLSVQRGRLLVPAAMLLLALVLLWFAPPLWCWAAALSGTIWLVRSLYRYQSLLTAAADAALTLLALTAASSSLAHSHSLLLALWCYFLLQSLHVCIPPRFAAATAATASVDPFAHAAQHAEAALRRLATRS